VASWDAMLAEWVAADKVDKQRCHETAAREKALANNAKGQRRQESAARAAALAESVSAKEQRCRELAECATVLAERTLANERCCREAAERSATLAKIALAKEQCHSLSAEVALAEYDAQTKASQDAAAVEAAKRAIMLAVTALAKLEATPKLRYSGPPPTHFSLPLPAAEVAELNAAILNKQCRHKTAAQEKALANNANEQHCGKANKPRCHKAATWEKALADNSCKQLCQELAKRTAASAKLALAAERTVVSADLALPWPALAKNKQRQQETSKKQCRVDDERIMVPVLPPNPINVAIWHIWVECALLAAPLDAILAEIEGNNMAHKAQALPTITLPHPAAMLSTPPAL
jgi:hypothetical protein